MVATSPFAHSEYKRFQTLTADKFGEDFLFHGVLDVKRKTYNYNI